MTPATPLNVQMQSTVEVMLYLRCVVSLLHTWNRTEAMFPRR